MLYNLLYPLSVDYSILNIFKYITFRSAWALVTALAVSILVGPYFIRWLQAIKCRQEILKEVKAHQCKAGTPTMGGLLIVFAVSVSVLLWADLTNAYVWMTMLVFIGFSAVGFIDDFMKVELRTAKVVACEPVPKAKKLLRLQLDLGYERRQVVSGIAKWYRPEDLIGRKLIVVANLKPATLCGVESNGMVLASGEETVRVVFLADDTPLGERVR